MSELTKIDGLHALSGQYNALLCDAWGVIHDGVSLFPEAADALFQFRRSCGPVIIVTNAPRPSSIIPAQLDRLRLPRNAYDGVVTSGDATRAEIKRRMPGPFYCLGPEKDDPLYEGLDLEFSSLEDARFIICTGLVDDQTESPEVYRDLLERAVRRGSVMICANPDTIVRWGGRLIYCAGALGELYRSLGGEVVYGGKPHPPIYQLAKIKLKELNADGAGPRRILVIGDGLATDIAGANAQGLDAVFVSGAGGIHEGELDCESIRQMMDAERVHAVATMEALRW